MNRVRRDLLKRFTIVNLIMLALVYATETFIAERNWFAMFITYAPQALFLLPGLILMFYASLRRKWWLSGANFAVIILGGTLLLGVSFSASSDKGDSIRVISYNIRHGDKGASEIWQSISKQNPDIICIQEMSPQRGWPDPWPKFKKIVPKEWHTVRNGEFVTLSRYPIESSTNHSYSDLNFAVLETKIKVGGQRLTVLNTHLSNITPLGLLKVWRDKSQLEYVRQKMSARSKQIDTLTKLAGDAKGALVLAGDFNTPPNGFLYDRIGSRLQDSFRAAGTGFGYTFRTNVPLWRIDYIFTDRKTSILKCYVANERSSNHKPLIADISFVDTVHKEPRL